jgi:hypothetical protein
MAAQSVTLLRTLHYKLHDFQQSRLEQRTLGHVSTIPSKEDRAVRTEHEQQPNTMSDVMTVYSEHTDQPYETTVEPGALENGITAPQ